MPVQRIYRMMAPRAGRGPLILPEGAEINSATEWLAAGPPWVRHRTLVDLLEQEPDDAEVMAARRAMVEDIQVRGLLGALSEWPGSAMKGHNDASHLLHRVTFLADLGLTVEDPGIGAIAERILAHQSQEGAFQTLLRVPESFGGTGEDQLAWMLCDSPQLLYALLRFGLREDPQVGMAVRHLAGLVQENGWRCVVSPELGKFRGPGRKADPCPYATLLALKALSLTGEGIESDACRVGAETLLGLWDQRRERRPYLFAMGTDFAKLKTPLIWYDILHVTEVLTRFPWLRSDPRLAEMVSLVAGKSDHLGRFTPESIWTAWKGWEFGQKREPSRWLTLQVLRMLARLG